MARLTPNLVNASQKKLKKKEKKTLKSVRFEPLINLKQAKNGLTLLTKSLKKLDISKMAYFGVL